MGVLTCYLTEPTVQGFPLGAPATAPVKTGNNSRVGQITNPLVISYRPTLSGHT